MLMFSNILRHIHHDQTKYVINDHKYSILNYVYEVGRKTALNLLIKKGCLRRQSLVFAHYQIP